MADDRHVVLIHGTWGRGDSWGPARTAFEERGYTVHTPTLRHHELPLAEGADKIAPLSLHDYVDDLAALVESIEAPPLLVGFSLGGLLAQLVAARTRHAGLVAACPAPAAGIFPATPTTLRSFGSVFGRHYLRSKPWEKPLYPPDWQRVRRWFTNAHTDEAARKLFADSFRACDSGRVYCEMLFWFMDRGRASFVNFDAVRNPVLAISGEYDRVVSARCARLTASRYQRGTYAQIPRSDHFVFSGDALPLTMSVLDDWLSGNHIPAEV